MLTGNHSHFEFCLLCNFRYLVLPAHCRYFKEKITLQSTKLAKVVQKKGFPCLVGEN